LLEPSWKEIVEQILPRACARQAREGAKALALGGRVGLTPAAMAAVADDIRREYDGLAMAQQKLAELLAAGTLEVPVEVDLSPIAAAMGALQRPGVQS
jgi:hypothetical protein